MLPTDRVRTVRIYKAPPGVSRAEFEAQFKSMFATMIKLSIVQKKLLKYQMCFARNNLDEPARAVPFGVAKTDSIIVAIIEAESHEALEIGEDPAFRKFMNASVKIWVLT
ncbi:hypothetical protein B0H13DRAFT_1892541 [Mycena leptocephala]|nr:hypothetical protein B0H13DRAFT_1892541 [Mycena leptocephala]